MPKTSPFYIPPGGGPNEWRQSMPESSPYFVPPPSWSYVPTPYVNPVQPYQGRNQTVRPYQGKQMSGFEPLAMLQQYRQPGSPALEQQASLQQVRGSQGPTSGK